MVLFQINKIVNIYFSEDINILFLRGNIVKVCLEGQFIVIDSVFWFVFSIFIVIFKESKKVNRVEGDSKEK